ncbi:MAG: hypothetical protein JWM80_407, partial [Cyanobacteria bacterium RYN_339]|nr:hypothetical protein [Cyanobacteria bacterium RYN_339]
LRREQGAARADSRATLVQLDRERKAARSTERSLRSEIGELARRVAAAEAHAEVLELAYQAAMAAAGATTAAELVRALAPAAARLCGAERVVLLAGDALVTLAASDDAAPISTTIARWVYTEARPLHLLDPLQEEGFNLQASVQALGRRTVDVVPAVHGGRTLGVLYTDHARLEDTSAAGLDGLARLGAIAGAFLARQEAR